MASAKQDPDLPKDKNPEQRLQTPPMFEGEPMFDSPLNSEDSFQSMSSADLAAEADGKRTRSAERARKLAVKEALSKFGDFEAHESWWKDLNAMFVDKDGAARPNGN